MLMFVDRLGRRRRHPPQALQVGLPGAGRQEAARLAAAQAVSLTVHSAGGRGSSSCPSNAPSHVQSVAGAREHAPGSCVPDCSSWCQAQVPHAEQAAV